MFEVKRVRVPENMSEHTHGICVVYFQRYAVVRWWRISFAAQANTTQLRLWYCVCMCCTVAGEFNRRQSANYDIRPLPASQTERAEHSATSDPNIVRNADVHMHNILYVCICLHIYI